MGGLGGSIVPQPISLLNAYAFYKPALANLVPHVCGVVCLTRATAHIKIDFTRLAYKLLKSNTN